MKKTLSLLLTVIWATVVLFSYACSQDGVKIVNGTDGDSDTDSDTDSDGDSDGDSDSDSDGDSDGDSDDSDTEICAEANFTISQSPVALMILGDMSLSMAPSTGGEEPGKWAIAEVALGSLLTTFADSQIAFGLDIFPNSPSGPKGCEISTEPKYDCEMDNAKTIAGNLPYKEMANGSTPLYKAMNNYLNGSYAPGCMNQEWQTYLLVISDGGDTCGFNDGAVTPKDLGDLSTQLLNEGIKTFTIGFGKSADPVELNAISAAGGTMFTKYLPASDQKGLEDALNNIASSLVSCNYNVPLVGDKADSNKVNFYFNKKIVPMDEDCKNGKGWRWTSDKKDRVLFCKEACEQLQSGETIEVSATWGCPTEVVE